MTKAQLRAAVKREARVKSGTQLDAMIDDIIADIMRDHCNRARYYETLVENHALTPVAGQQSYDLPTDFMNLENVRFGHGPSATRFRTVKQQSDGVHQTSSSGYPRYYRLVQGPKLSFWPYADLAVSDSLVIDYYADPASFYTEETSPFPIPRLESAVKKEAIARVQRFHSSNTESQMTDADAAASVSAADSASS